LATTGVPAIVVPRPQSDDQAQNANAKAMERQGGCVTLDEQSTEPLEAQLARRLSQLLHNDVRRAQMAQAMLGAACPDAAGQIASLCAETLGVTAARAAA
jgi:UDP-N-acetylglucosamine:LPS N-acetylglucosamine transferase